MKLHRYLLTFNQSRQYDATLYIVPLSKHNNVDVFLCPTQTLLRDPKVLEEGLKKLNTVLESLEPLHQPLEPPGGSVLLRELAGAAHLPDPTASPSATPLLHALSSTHAYITMFVHVCKMGQVRLQSIELS